MCTPQLKCSELSLEHLRPSSGRVYSHSRSPDSSAEARVSLKKVAWVISELLETELTYLESLRDIKEGYYLPLLAEGKFDATTLDTVFNNIIQLHAFHQTFSGELYRNQENLVGLADVFLEHAVDFEGLYVEFCTEHSLSIQTLEHESLLHTELWASILACQTRLGHLLPLASYLLKPVQRVLKYQLLLQELVKGCTLAGLGQNQSIFNGDPNFVVKHLQSALERMIQVATHINEAKRRHELIGQLRASGFDVDQWGCLLLRDVFRLPAKKHACRLVLLFERAILLAKKFYAGNNSAPNLKDLQSSSGEGLQSVLEIRDIISCNNLMLIECIDKDPLAFHILPFNNPNAQKTLQAASADVKHLWCREIKRVILENFDAAIPEKAKHLMLHMEDICPRPKLSDTSSQVGLHSIDESEEEHAPRRKGSSVLTAIFKRRSRIARSSSAKLQVSENTPPPPSATLNDSDGSDNPRDGSEADVDDADHVALVQDAWNALMAKHSSSTTAAAAATPTTTVTPLFSTTPTALDKQQEVNGVEEEDEEDFRCIAVEINEERFAVDLVQPQKVSEFKPISPPKVWQNGLAHTLTGASIYIECQEASQYDTVTFGRAYEQYIAKTRSMATLSPGEVDEILRPLLTLTEDHSHHIGPCASGKAMTLNGEADDNRMPTLASSEDCSGASSSTSCASPMSVCQLVSRIGIDSSTNNTNSGADGGSDRVTAAYRPSPSRVATQSSVAKATPRPSTASPIARNDSAKSPAVRKYSAPQVSTRMQHSKPPRNLGLSRLDTTPSLRSNQLTNGSGVKTASRANGTTALPSKLPPNSTVTLANAHNEEAASLCQGRFRAAVANLRPFGGQGASIATSTASTRPSKPPRRSWSSTKTTSECKGGCGRARTSTSSTSLVMSSVSTMTSTVVGGQGHVKHLIDRFQNN
ncbi:Pleckstrin homology domain-containing family G member 1 [Echinococcus granulosus]|uniref:DH domain containing protein n=1 Tax=Echinococcus granulosus TaxID=6210 RepID=A0A068WMG8_ECHGR|nr:Pleckstrin homology domain-containing family G member 1 [Echinococcus granulosus]CDS20976.1 DH domain containing protein [Echinococcus granulosus]